MKHSNPFFPIRISFFVVIAILASLCFPMRILAQVFEAPEGETVLGTEIETTPKGTSRIVWTSRWLYDNQFYKSTGRFGENHLTYCTATEGRIRSAHFVQKNGVEFIVISLSDGSVVVKTGFFTVTADFINLNTGEIPQNIIGDALYILTNQNIYVSRDTAKTWKIDTTGLGGTPHGIAIDSQQFVYAITNNGLFRQHPDTNIWRAMPTLPPKANLNNIFIDRRNRIYIAVNQNGYRLLYHSLDRGATWNVDTTGMGPQNFTGFGDDAYGNIYAIAQDPYTTSPDKIYRSNGVSWTRIDAPLSALNTDKLSKLRVFTAIAGDSVLVVTTIYGVFSSTDQGRTWSESNSGMRAERVYGLVLSPSNNFVASTNLGVFRRKNVDSVWTKTFPTNGYLGGQPLFRDNTGAIYTLGEIPLVDQFNQALLPRLTMKSTDDGTTWFADTLGISALKNVNLPIFFVDETGTQHLATFNNSITPGHIFVKKPGQPWADDAAGYNGGESYTVPQAFGSDGMGSLWMSDPVQHSATLLKRPITGGAWAPDTLGLGGEILNSFAAAKNGMLYAGGFSGVWRRSGTSWSKLPPPTGLYTTTPSYSISIDSSGVLIAGFQHFDANYNSIGDGVFATTDDGAHWTNLGHVDTTTFVQLVSYGNITYGLSYFDGVFVFTTGASGVNEKFYPASLNELAVFPNPAKSEMRISYSIPKHSDVVLSIFDMSGKKIIATASEAHDAGAYEKLWNVRSLPNGSYILKLTACGESVTKVVEVVK